MWCAQTRLEESDEAFYRVALRPRGERTAGSRLFFRRRQGSGVVDCVIGGVAGAIGGPTPGADGSTGKPLWVREYRARKSDPAVRRAATSGPNAIPDPGWRPGYAACEGSDLYQPQTTGPVTPTRKNDQGDQVIVEQGSPEPGQNNFRVRDNSDDN